MYDLRVEFRKFYDDHVRLGKERRDELAKIRDINLDRIRKGLEDLSKESKKTYAPFYDYKNQGSYAMHTLNQANENDYDLDVGLMFKSDDLPDDPLSARQRVRDALSKRGANFSEEPEARTNAVTVWYEDGYHLDFAVYRTSEDWFGNEVIEHASTKWIKRDPMEVNKWFDGKVASLSPKPTFLFTPKVEPGQLRRIVRFAKRFCRSRASWALPGGMVMTTLVVECYKPDSDRDDLAFYNTLNALAGRLSWSSSVENPVNPSVSLTVKTELENQVKRLKKKLDIALKRLAVLSNDECTREQARYAWDWVFNHDFWGIVENEAELADAAVSKGLSDTTLPYTVKLRCQYGKSQSGPLKDYRSGGTALPKGQQLKFTVASTTAPGSYAVRWTVRNAGDEAQDANDLSWTKNENVCWSSTKYKGIHTMTAEVLQNGRVVARGKHVIKIKGSRWSL